MLDVPEALLLVTVIQIHDDGDNVELEPQAGAQGRAYVRERGGKPCTDKLGEVIVFIQLDSLNDVVGDEILPFAKGVIDCDVFNGEVNQVNHVVNGERDDGSVGISEDG